MESSKEGNSWERRREFAEIMTIGGETCSSSITAGTHVIELLEQERRLRLDGSR